MKKVSGVMATALVIVSVPTVFLFAQNTAWIDGLAGQIKALFNVVMPILFAGTFAVFVWGMIGFIFQADNEQVREAGKKRMIWGVLALFTVISIWGIIYILQVMFGASSATPPPAPGTSYLLINKTFTA